MRECPKCGAESCVFHLTTGGVGVNCAECDTHWTLMTVPEPYLRDLIARSLELAALKQRLNLP